MSSQFRKYLAYAIGELLLVVVGILIALQIDNWNEDRKEQATLQSYLESIARNMREDLAELEPLREHRVESLFLNSRYDTIRNLDRYEVEEIFFFNRIWNDANVQAMFSANTSGFEALKSSGVLNRLQGSGYERLLSRYLDTVDQIRLQENSMNNALIPLNTELRQMQSGELEPWAIINPSALSPERFEAAHPLYAALIDSPTAAALVDGQFRNHSLVQLYDSLKIYGESFISATESGQGDATMTLPRTPLDDAREGLGTADFVIEGRTFAESYWLTNGSGPADNVFRLDSIKRKDGVIRVDYPGGDDWAVIYWGTTNSSSTGGLSYLDYSKFNQLKLELKGNKGGEMIRVHVKDVDYPNDIAPISVDLVLSDEWQTWEIDVAEFAPNDMSRLHVPLGLLIFPAEEPLSFSIRNARYE